MLWKPLEAGMLDKRVQIVLPLEQTSQKTTFNEVPTSPKVVATVWANIEDVTGAEPWFAEQPSPETSHTVRIRYLKVVSTRHQVLYGPGWTRVFDITAVIDPMQRHEQLVLLCRERIFTQA